MHFINTIFFYLYGTCSLSKDLGDAGFSEGTLHSHHFHRKSKPISLWLFFAKDYRLANSITEAPLWGYRGANCIIETLFQVYRRANCII